MRKATFVAALLMSLAAHAAVDVSAVPEHALRRLDAENLKVARRTGRMPIALPDGSVVRFVPLSQRERHGVTTIRGRQGEARLLLTSDGSNAYGFVETATGHYRITTEQDEVLIVDGAALAEPVDLLGVTPGDDTVIDPQWIETIRERLESRADLVAADEIYSVVDIAIFLDPALLDIESAQALRTTAQAFVDFTNEALIQNAVQAELNLVLVEMFAGSFNALDPFPGFAANAAMHARADQFGADLRHFLYFQRSGIGYCGTAYLVGSSGVSGYQCGAGTFAHEVGHNFGAHHDRANAGNNVTLPISAYNFGFVCGGAGTIMSYVGSPRLSHYSDPLLSRNGEACGIAEGQPNAAHNGRVIEVMRTQIESLRTPPASYGSVRFSAAALALSETGEGAEVTITRDGDLTREVSVEVATVDESTDGESDYVPVLTRLQFAANETSKVIRIEPLDDEDYEPEETFRLVLRYPLGLSVAGVPLTVTLSSDDLDRGTAEVEVESASAWENGGPVTVVINRTGTTTHPLTVAYATVDGDAVAGEQYQSVAGQLTFAPGETRMTVAVPIIDNDRYETPRYRSFQFVLSGANLGPRRSQTIFVWNDDPNRGRSQFAVSEGEVAETAGTVNVVIERIDGNESTLFVEYATADGNAVAGRDYVAAAGSFTFQPGETQRVIPVTITDNERFDGRRAFTMTMRGQSLAERTVTGITIVNDDPDRGLAEFAQAQHELAETAGTVTIPVRRTGGTEGTLTVSYATENGTAESPRDFQSATGQVSFAPGVTEAAIPVTVVDNIYFGQNLTFTLRLSGQLTGSQASTSVTIVNDDPNRGRAQFEGASASASEAVGTATLAVVRIDGTESTLSVSYATSDGTARAGVDYQSTSGTVTFQPGDTRQTISVPITNNTIVDASRTFTLNLTGDFVGPNAALSVTITNDDAPPAASGGGGGGGGGGSFNALLLGLLLLLLLPRRFLRPTSQFLSLMTDDRCRRFNPSRSAPMK